MSNNSDIRRIPGHNPFRSRAVIHGGFVWTVAAASPSLQGMRAQTEGVLKVIDASLREAGTDRTRLLTATVYITDMALKPEMDAAWDAYIPRSGGPQRACVQVASLMAGELVEIAVMAALP